MCVHVCSPIDCEVIEDRDLKVFTLYLGPPLRSQNQDLNISLLPWTPERTKKQSTMMRNGTLFIKAKKVVREDAQMPINCRKWLNYDTL